jgi:hypothetical protein
VDASSGFIEHSVCIKSVSCRYVSVRAVIANERYNSPVHVFSHMLIISFFILVKLLSTWRPQYHSDDNIIFRTLVYFTWILNGFGEI